MKLNEIRRWAGKTQKEVAKNSGMSQSEVSKFEHRDDHLLSTLRRYVNALGGELEIVITFDDKKIIIKY